MLSFLAAMCRDKVVCVRKKEMDPVCSLGVVLCFRQLGLSLANWSKEEGTLNKDAP